MVDHCRAIDLILKRGRVGETYNIGSGFEVDVETIADTILDVLGQDASSKVLRSGPTRTRSQVPSGFEQVTHPTRMAPGDFF